MRSGRSHDFVFCLTSYLIDWSLVCQFIYKLIRLYIDVLFAWRCLWGLYIPSEELLCCFCSLLFEPFWVILFLVSLEELVGVSSSWNHHCSISASSENSLVVSNVLWIVLFFLCATIWIFIFGFVRYNSWMGSKALTTFSWLLLGKHFEFFI